MRFSDRISTAGDNRLVAWKQESLPQVDGLETPTCALFSSSRSGVATCACLARDHVVIYGDCASQLFRCILIDHCRTAKTHARLTNNGVQPLGRCKSGSERTATQIALLLSCPCFSSIDAQIPPLASSQYYRVHVPGVERRQQHQLGLAWQMQAFCIWRLTDWDPCSAARDVMMRIQARCRGWFLVSEIWLTTCTRVREVDGIPSRKRKRIAADGASQPVSVITIGVTC